jgi:uncharacterized protein YndB with AHSA1/START domain
MLTNRSGGTSRSRLIVIDAANPLIWRRTERVRASNRRNPQSPDRRAKNPKDRLLHSTASRHAHIQEEEMTTATETKKVAQQKHGETASPMPNTVQFHLVLRTTPERLYRAFIDPDAMAKWLPPNGFTGKVHHMDPRVGGTYKMSFTNFTSGKSHSFGGEYLELVPHERLRWTDRFDDPNLPGEMTTTVRLNKVSVGTEVNIVQEGLPDVMPPDACSLGWQESLTLLAKLVEAEIPD